MIILPGYQVAASIYEGDKSIVYRGLRDADSKPVAIKLFYKPYPGLEELERFRREYDITRMFDSHGIIKAYDFERYNHSSAIVLEDFPGKSLDAWLKEAPIHPAQFLPLAIRIAEALDQIHRKHVIHRDINPGNILWDKDSGQIRIIDFSISTYVYSKIPDILSHDALQGTLAYMAPEQTGRLNRPVDYYTDYYSLGVTFYHMLTGRRPFESDDPMTLVHSHMAIQPEAPLRINPRIPRTMSDIIMKLMAKDAGDRYQTLPGLIWDLQTCLDRLSTQGRIPVFEIGTKDILRSFHIPQKLYGRDDEILMIRSAFDRAAIGKKEKILIAGPSGIGKSALISQVKKDFGQTPGYFIYGKFDPFHRNIPYSALTQAAKELFYQIAAGGEASILFWKEKLIKALGSNSQVMANLIPEVELIIGRQSEIQELSSAESQSRLHLAVLSFLSVFDLQKQVLAICIDDLQWADEASLKVIELVLNEPDLGHLLFIGTYRDNEVPESHPLTGLFKRIDQSDTPIIRIFLKLLGKTDINRFLSEMLLCRPDQSEGMASLCHEKTHGNPFFFIQMVQSLYEDRHIFYDPDAGCWKWDADAIRRASITDNVVELMINAIHRLNDRAQHVLTMAACIGTRFDLKTLSAVSGEPVMETAQQLWQALEHGLILQDTKEPHDLKKSDRQTDAKDKDIGSQEANHVYEFVHSRVCQAAYELLPEDEKIRIQLKIGYILLDSFRKDESSASVFDIVIHLNAGSAGIIDPEQRFVLAQLNLRAGKRAKTVAAFEPSLKYLKSGISLLPENRWTQTYPETFELYFEAAESAFFCTDFEEMKKLADVALENACSVLDKAKIYSLRVQYHYAQNELIKVVEEGVTILGLMGYRFPANPTKVHILLKLARARLALVGKMPFDVNKSQDIQDPAILTAMRIMFHLGHAAFGARPNLPPLLSLQGLILSLNRGVGPETPASFIFYGIVLCGVFNKINAGYGFAQLALKLNDRPCVQNFRVRAVFAMGSMIVHWKHHLKDSLRPYLLSAYDIGMAAGDYEFATLSAFFYCAYSYFSGAPLPDLADEMAAYSTTIRRSRQTTHFYFNEMARQVVLNLIRTSDDPCRLVGEAYDEDRRLPEHQKVNDTSAIHMLFLYKMQLCFLFGRYQEAIECSHIAETCLGGMVGTAYVPLFYFYDSLIRLALLPEEKKSEKRRLDKKIASNQKKLKKWALHSPMNYEHKWMLVEAERMRVSGHTSKALACYDIAISLAEKQGYIQEEALANELAARFWLGKENSDIADVYLKKAFYCYELWGATAKADSMYQGYPVLMGLKWDRLSNHSERIRNRLAASTASQSLDLESVIKASQTISGEILLEELIKKLMTVVVENSGAQKALLLSPVEKQWRIEAQAQASHQGIDVSIITKTAGASDAPLSIFQYTALTRETVLLNNAAREGAFQPDEYVRNFQPRSVLSLPILHQGKIKNIIYLENNLIEGVFTVERVELLRLVSSQAAISLENARFYARLQASEKKYRAIFENAVEGLFQISPDGRFISANKTMAALLGFSSPETLMNDRTFVINDLFPDSLERDRFVATLLSSGQVSGFEGRGVRKDGGEFWIVISAREVRDSHGDVLHYEGSLVDITERKAREKAEREKEAAQAAARVKSEFLANMSHDIRTPMNAVIGFTELVAETGLSLEQSAYIERIKDSSKTLLSIINDILDFSKVEAGKLELECVAFDLNVIFDKIAWMFARQKEKQGIELIFSTSGNIPGLRGDPLRLERVLMNLVSNALKFTETGEIVVSAELLENKGFDVRIRFVVSDTGIGIAKEDTGKLFQAFSQADSSITRQYGGTGLGLAICKSIVEKMGGTIRVESMKGQGSRFIFDVFLKTAPELILLPGAEAHPPKTAESKVPESIKGIHVLVVEDSETNRQIIRSMMVRAGLRVTMAHNGRQALSAIEGFLYDAVLMDLQMPGMDGYETSMRIRRNPRHKHLPIIALTAYSPDGIREKCLAAGINDVIAKPIDFSKFFVKLARYVDAAGPLGIGDGVPENKREDAAPFYLFKDDLFKDDLSGEDWSAINLSGRFEGVDVAAGLERLGGRRKLYVKVLREFRKEYHDAPELLANALEAGDGESIHRIAHTIKGLAVNFGAEDLQSIAEKIETACVPDGSLPTLSDLDAFNDQLKAWFTASEKIEAFFDGDASL